MYVNLGVSRENAVKAAKKAHEYILRIENFYIYEDTRYVLDECMNMGIESYVISNNYSEIRDILAKLDLDKYFKGMVISADVGYDKPRRELFEYALDIAGNPKDSIMVGDNPFADVKGGNEVGMTTILVHNDIKDNNAGYQCDTLTDVLEVIKRIIK